MGKLRIAIVGSGVRADDPVNHPYSALYHLLLRGNYS